MAFIMSSFLGGAAKRASEIMQEERENTQKIVDASMKFWTETGISNYKDRKSKRKNLSMQFDTLTNNGFSADQIEVIARENGVEKVLNHIESMRGAGIAVKPADIVRFSPDYKDTGRTKEEILNSVMGKINRGMDVSDAIQDVTGGKRGFLGQNLDRIAQKRAEAFSGAFGMDMSELKALATDDITMEESPVSGQLFLKDPVAEAQAEKAMKGTETGAITSSRALTALTSTASGLLGADLPFDAYGNPIYSADKQDLQLKAVEIGQNALIEFQRLRDEGIPSGKALQMATQTIPGYKTRQSATAPQSSQTIQPPTNVGMGVYGGMTSSSIQAQAIRDAQGLSVREKATILQQARNAIIQDLEKSMTPADAAVEADKIIADLESKI
jgi:hypothetical protein